jgi:hypothetical protein
MRTWKPFIGAAVLAAALTAPTAAQAPDVSKQLEEIKGVLQSLSAKIGKDMTDLDMKIGKNLNELRNDLDSLRREVDALKQNLKTEQVRGSHCDQEVSDLKHRLEEVQAQCKKDTENLRRSFSFTPTAPTGPSGGSDSTTLPAPPPPPPPPATGTVLLRNFSDVNATFIVNGQPYAVLAGQTQSVRNIPAGTFTYQIQAEGFGLLRPLSSRYLPPAGTYTLNIDPRPVATVCP